MSAELKTRATPPTPSWSSSFKDSLLAFFSPNKPIEDEGIFVEQVRAAMCMCIFVVVYSPIGTLMLYINGTLTMSELGSYTLSCVTYTSMFLGLKYSRRTKLVTLILAVMMLVLTQISYVTVMTTPRTSGETAYPNFLMLAIPPVMSCVVLPPYLSLRFVIFNSIESTVVIYYFAAMKTWDQDISLEVLCKIFFDLVIIAKCLVSSTYMQRIKSQQNRMKIFLDASREGMVVVDVDSDALNAAMAAAAADEDEDGSHTPRNTSGASKKESKISSGTPNSRAPANNPASGVGGIGVSSGGDSGVDDDDDDCEGGDAMAAETRRESPSAAAWKDLVLNTPVKDNNIVFERMFGLDGGTKGLRLCSMVEILDSLGSSYSSVNVEVQNNLHSERTIRDEETGIVETILTTYQGIGTRTDGSTFPLEVVVQEITSGTEKIGIVALSDMTEMERVMEIAKRHEVEQQTTTAKADFLDTISHELRNPVHSIVGTADVLLNTNEPLSPSVKHHIQSLNATGHTLLSIINQILDFSKLGAERIVFNNETVGLVAFLESMVDEVDVLARAKNLVVAYDYDKRLDTVFSVDPVRLGQVLRNFLINAIKYTNQGGVGLVAKLRSDSPTHTTVLFEVHDTGPGIEPEDQKTIFDRFTQVKGTKTSFASTGLGLAIAAQIVNKFKGSITVESEMGVGSTFGFTVKLKKPAPQGSSFIAQPRMKGVRLLVYEPVGLMRTLIMSRLRGEGAQVAVFSDFPELVAVIEAASDLPNGLLCLRPLTEVALTAISSAVEHHLRAHPYVQEDSRRGGGEFTILSTDAIGATVPPDLSPGIRVLKVAGSVFNSALVEAFVKQNSGRSGYKYWSGDLSHTHLSRTSNCDVLDVTATSRQAMDSDVSSVASSAHTSLDHSSSDGDKLRMPRSSRRHTPPKKRNVPRLHINLDTESSSDSGGNSKRGRGSGGGRGSSGVGGSSGSGNQRRSRRSGSKANTPTKATRPSPSSALLPTHGHRHAAANDSSSSSDSMVELWTESDGDGDSAEFGTTGGRTTTTAASVLVGGGSAQSVFSSLQGSVTAHTVSTARTSVSGGEDGTSGRRTDSGGRIGARTQSGRGRSGSPAILLIDSNEDSSTLTSHMLAMNKYEVVTVVSNKEAIQVLSNGARISLVIADFHLKYEKNGQSLRCAIEAVAPKVRTVAIVEGNSADDLASAGAVFDAVLSKPFTHNELNEAVRSVLNGSDSRLLSGGV